ncbi:MAG TPA: M23 family metallopeptidase, partial [Candidatus Baltobacteraceae bacterium]|nr:M23 family metallopeptidase [Candidatus Baltobacteraceae bacterium]
KIHSIFSGEVAFAGRLPGYDHVVIINHGDHYYSLYAHLDRVTVASGQSVAQGQALASADQDLYFEIRHFSDAIDPKPWLNKKRGSL